MEIYPVTHLFFRDRVISLVQDVCAHDETHELKFKFVFIFEGSLLLLDCYLVHHRCFTMGIESVLESSDSDKSSSGLTRKGGVLLGVFGGLFVGIYTLTGPFLAPAVRKICLPFLPASSAQMKNVFKALGSKKGSLLDIGSGDGRIVIEAARHGYKASGIELNMWLVLYSRLAARRAGMNKTATFKRQDLWKSDISPYNNVVIFGVRQMMEPLEQKLEKELTHDSMVVACRFHFPNWEPILTLGEGVDTVWLYRINKKSVTNPS